jgi:hypothetical protein
VRLARRARGEQVGLVTTVHAGPNDRRGRLVVVPVDASGVFGEPIDLGRADLADRAARGCAAGDDGWLLELPWDRPPALVDVEGDRRSPRVSGLEARVRLDPGSFCVESFAATADAPLAAARGERAATGDRVPLAVTNRVTSQRWGLACAPKR